MADALKQMEPNLQLDATDILRAFDVNRERIHSIAAKVYAQGAGALTISTSVIFEIYFIWRRA